MWRGFYYYNADYLLNESGIIGLPSRVASVVEFYFYLRGASPLTVLLRRKILAPMSQIPRD